MSLTPPLDVLKALAKRVAGSALYSSKGVLRGPDPADGAERDADKTGFADFHGVSPEYHIPRMWY